MAHVWMILVSVDLLLINIAFVGETVTDARLYLAAAVIFVFALACWAAIIWGVVS